MGGWGLNFSRRGLRRGSSSRAGRRVHPEPCKRESREMIGTHIEIILIVTGATTAMALAQFIAPTSVCRIIYGAAPTEVVGIALVRHWGLLIFLVGVLLIYAAFHPEIREPITIVAAVEKIGFGLGIFATSLRRHPIAAGIAMGDILIPIVYVLYLVGL
jgi:hypothetical protein